MLKYRCPQAGYVGFGRVAPRIQACIIRRVAAHETIANIRVLALRRGARGAEKQGGIYQDPRAKKA